jgi:hypothetical protein
MDKKVCQNPYCSGYKTDDRFIKVGGQKYLADRVNSSLRYQNGNFCTTHCFEEWFGIYGDRAIDFIGRKTERSINYNNISINRRRNDLAVNLPNGWLDYHNSPQIRQQIETQLLSELQSNNNA